MSNIKSFLLKQSFQPNWISIFINPFFLIRKGLYSNIKGKASSLKGKLIDFGCGRKPYKNLFDNVEDYIGVDIEISGHNHQYSEIDIFYNGKNIPVQNDYFDSLFCGEVVEHLFNLEEILPELNRVLKKGGIGLLTFPFSWPEHEKPYDFARYTTFSSKFIFEKYNFEILEISKSGNFIEVIFQYIIYYIFLLIPTKNAVLKQIFMIPFTTVFNILGIIFSFILPTQKDLYFNNIIVIKKK